MTSAGGLVRQVVTFGRILREGGLEVGPGRISDALTGVDRLDIGDPDDVYWTLRTTLVSRPEDLGSFDRAFAAWFLRDPSAPPYRGSQPAERTGRTQQKARTDAHDEGEHVGDEPTEVGWSVHEVLRKKDFASMTAEEFSRTARALKEVAAARPLRRSRRLRPHARGRRLDLRRLARRSLGRGATPSSARFGGESRFRASWSSCATSRARWRRTPGRCSSSCTRSSARVAVWRCSRSERGCTG